MLLVIGDTGRVKAPIQSGGRGAAVLFFSNGCSYGKY
jgi:hypothetical protein